MKLENVCIPVAAAWSSPFARWQGPAADVSSLELVTQVTRRALADRGVDWPFTQLVFGITIPQKEAFFGPPTLAARLGLGHISGPMVAQACATSVACVHLAAADQQGSSDGARLVVATRQVVDLGLVQTDLRALRQSVAPIRPCDGLTDETVRILATVIARRDHGLDGPPEMLVDHIVARGRLPTDLGPSACIVEPPLAKERDAQHAR